MKKITKIDMGRLISTTNALLKVWDDHKAGFKVKGKTLFAFIGLKKELEKRLSTSQETIAMLAEQHGGIFKQEIGGFEIPEDQRAAANAAINELMDEELEITHSPIIFTEEDDIPAELLDIIFDFVEMAE